MNGSSNSGSGGPQLRSFRCKQLLSWVLTVTGTLVARTPDTVNPDLPTGEVELRIESVAVQSVAHPDPPRPLYDASCLDEQTSGPHRAPNQSATTSSAAYMPRGSLLVGPFWGLSLTASAGKGVRSIDPA